MLKAMARDPDDRYQDVEGLARALEPFAEGVTFRTERADPTGPQRSLSTTATPFVSDGPVRVPVRRGSIGLMVASAGIAVAGGLIWGLQSAPGEPGAASRDDAIVAPKPSGSAAGAPGPSAKPMPATPADDAKDGGTVEERALAVQGPQAGAAAAAQPAHGSADGLNGKPAVERPGSEDRHRSRRRPAVEAVTAPAPGSRPTPVTRPGGRTGALRSDEF